MITEPGSIPTVEAMRARAACEELVHVFYERLDDGDIDGAFALHADDLEFHPPGSPTPIGRAAAAQDAARVRLAYPGRRTLHVATSFTGRLAAPDLLDMDYLMTVYELTEPVDGVAVDRAEPVIFALARERCRFRLDAGAWRFIRQRIEPIAAARATWGQS